MATRQVFLPPGVATLVSNKEDWTVQNVSGIKVLLGEATSTPSVSTLAHQLSNGVGFSRVGGDCYCMPAGDNEAVVAVTETAA